MPKSDLASGGGDGARDRSSCIPESELVGDRVRSLRRSHIVKASTGLDSTTCTKS